MENIILEKIFKILNNIGMKAGFDNNNNITIDSNYYNINSHKTLHKWTSIDAFLLRSIKNKYIRADVSNDIFYHNSSIFDFLKYCDELFIYNKLNYSWFLSAQNITHFKLCHNANKILNQIKGDSLEEIAIKLDLIGI